jgi:hypothetical protein
MMKSLFFQPQLDSKTKRGETMNLEGRARLAPRAVRTELACARALLDELETVLDAESEERTRGDVVIQVADQLTRMASTMKQWKDSEAAEGFARERNGEKAKTR